MYKAETKTKSYVTQRIQQDNILCVFLETIMQVPTVNTFLGILKLELIAKKELD